MTSTWWVSAALTAWEPCPGQTAVGLHMFSFAQEDERGKRSLYICRVCGLRMMLTRLEIDRWEVLREARALARAGRTKQSGLRTRRPNSERL